MNTALATVVIEGWTLATDGPEPMVRDVDLAERLAYEQPRMIRKLIKRMIEEGEITGVETRSTVERVARSGRGEVDIASTEYWLTEEQAYQVSQRSKGPQAAEVRRTLARAFIALRRGTTAPALDVNAFARAVMALVRDELRALPAPAVLAVPPEDVEAMIVSAGERFLISADPQKPIGKRLADALAERMRDLGHRLARHLHPDDEAAQKAKARSLISKAQNNLRKRIRCVGEKYHEIPTAYARTWVAWIDEWEAQINREHGGDPGAGPLFRKAS